MNYAGSCHCGNVRFAVEGELKEVTSCNCSICSRKGWLLWFVTPEQFRLETPDSALGTYRFNRHAIDHRFCTTCGISPFSSGTAPGGRRMYAVNVRCLEGVDVDALPVRRFDGRSL